MHVIISDACVLSEETAHNNDKDEDKDDVKEENWSIGRRKKRPSSKRDSDELDNFRSTHEFLESDTEKNEECEEDEDRY